MPQDSDGVRHTIRESQDFTPNGNRAERVQTMNVSGKVAETRGYFRLAACRIMSSTVIWRRAAENACSASVSAGRTTSFIR